jgi:hypothetical protein
MARIKKSFKKAFNYDNDLQNNAKKLEQIVINNFRKKDLIAKNEEKHIQTGIGGSLVKFDKKIKQKIKDY